MLLSHGGKKTESVKMTNLSSDFSFFRNFRNYIFTTKSTASFRLLGLNIDQHNIHDETLNYSYNMRVE